MLDIEKQQNRFPSESLKRMIKEYDRDFIQSASKKEIPPNPPPQPKAQPELPLQPGGAVKKKKKDT
jgi:hypothetical protein